MIHKTKIWTLVALTVVASHQVSASNSASEPTVVAISAIPAEKLTSDKAPDPAPANNAEATTPAPAPADPVPVPKLSKPELEQSVKCLALNIYHEARSEPEQGQRAVAAVTLNRVASPTFPDSVCKVVQQGGKKRNKCQFSWWCDKYSDKPREDAAWQHAIELSRKTLAGKVSDPTGGALYYHTKHVTPRWARTFKRTEKIGQHLFYKPKGA